MPHPDRSVSVPARIVFLLGLFALSWAGLGCREELGPEAMPTAKVAGRVHLGGRPIRGGWIEFLPAEGTVGTLRSARVRPDGTFEADRVAVGTNAIRLLAPKAEGPLPVDGRLLQGYLIRRTVPEGGTDTMEIDLRDESRRLGSSP
jgi:hypothetical protein